MLHVFIGWRDPLVEKEFQYTLKKAVQPEKNPASGFFALIRIIDRFG
jgi:hypothetical protein